MKTVLDIECTFQVDEDGKKDPSPYDPRNYLVSIGFSIVRSKSDYLCFRHNKERPTKKGFDILQNVLYNTTLLICHNTKFDLQWLWEANFDYQGPTYDTMIHDYLEAGGVPCKLDLTSCCRRHGVPGKKSDLVDKYLDKNIGFEAMPWEIVKEYGEADVEATRLLYLEQTNV